jgi:hypothetical protein
MNEITAQTNTSILENSDENYNIEAGNIIKNECKTNNKEIIIKFAIDDKKENNPFIDSKIVEHTYLSNLNIEKIETNSNYEKSEITMDTVKKTADNIVETYSCKEEKISNKYLKKLPDILKSTTSSFTPVIPDMKMDWANMLYGTKQLNSNDFEFIKNSTIKYFEKLNIFHKEKIIKGNAFCILFRSLSTDKLEALSGHIPHGSQVKKMYPAWRIAFQKILRDQVFEPLGLKY